HCSVKAGLMGKHPVYFVRSTNRRHMSSIPRKTPFGKHRSHRTRSGCSFLGISPMLVVGCFPSELAVAIKVQYRGKEINKDKAQQRASFRSSSRAVGELTVFLPVGKRAQVVGGCLFSELFGWVGAIAVGGSEWAPREAK